MVSHCLLLVLELESEVSKRTVGFCHTVHIFLALEGSTTDTAALDFYLRSDVVERSLPDLKSSLIFLLDLLAYDLKRGVEDIEGDILLTVVHQVINELRHLYVTKYGIR